MATLDTTPVSLPTGADELAPPLTFRQMAWRRFRRHRMAMVGAVTLILLFVYAFGGGLIGGARQRRRLAGDIVEVESDGDDGQQQRRQRDQALRPCPWLRAGS